MSASSKTGRAATYAIIVLIIVVGAAFLLNSRLGGVQVYDVYPTPSMRPTLAVGDLVVAVATSYNKIHIGDVIIFARPSPTGGCTNEIIVHRVVNITSAGLITQGDNRLTNPRPDEPDSWPPVPAECLKGLVVVSVPFLGKISEAFPPPYNYILVAAIVLLIFLVELYGGEKEKDKAEGSEHVSDAEVTVPPQVP